MTIRHLGHSGMRLAHITGKAPLRELLQGRFQAMPTEVLWVTVVVLVALIIGLHVIWRERNV